MPYLERLFVTDFPWPIKSPADYRLCISGGQPQIFRKRELVPLQSHSTGCLADASRIPWNAIIATTNVLANHGATSNCHHYLVVSLPLRPQEDRPLSKES